LVISKQVKQEHSDSADLLQGEAGLDPESVSRNLGRPYMYIPGSMYMLYIARSVTMEGWVNRTEIGHRK